MLTLYLILIEIEKALIQEAFEDDSPFGFSECFNDWNNKEEDIWEKYL